jgi:NAD(P)H-dependent FMN reductase
MSALTIHVILGTARKGAFTPDAARFVRAALDAAGHSGELIDPGEYPMIATDDTGTTEASKRYKALIAAADGFIIVSPEYNHGYPGELKLLLDQAFEEYDHKPVGICGASKGPYSGVRMVEQLRLVTIALGMYPTKRAVYFANIRSLFTDGVMDPAQEADYRKKVDGLIEHVAMYANALKTVRS